LPLPLEGGGRVGVKPKALSHAETRRARGKATERKPQRHRLVLSEVEAGTEGNGARGEYGEVHAETRRARRKDKG